MHVKAEEEDSPSVSQNSWPKKGEELFENNITEVKVTKMVKTIRRKNINS